MDFCFHLPTSVLIREDRDILVRIRGSIPLTTTDDAKKIAFSKFSLLIIIFEISTNNDGSGSGRPKNIRIRIQNAAANCNFYVILIRTGAGLRSINSYSRFQI
jgi:hypothetical protein